MHTKKTMVIPLIPPGASIHRRLIFPRSVATSGNTPQSNRSSISVDSHETAHEGIPSILFLGHHGGARQATMDAILNVNDGLSQVFIKKLEHRRKRNDVELYHIESTFGAAIKDPTNNADDGNAETQTIREANLVNTPDMGAERVSLDPPTRRVSNLGLR
jgi:hypothetical protein